MMTRNSGTKGNSTIPASTASATATPASSAPVMADEGVARLIDELRRDFSQRLDAYGARFDTLEKLLADSKQENRALQAAMEEKEREIEELKRTANDQEQYIRSWSIRIMDLPIPPNQDAHNNTVVMQLVYNSLLLPIFQGAVDNGMMPNIPTCDQVLEMAHILPCKPGSTPPIIARFFSRNIKALVFKLKRDFAPRTAHSRAANQNNRSSPAPFAHPFYEDLTRYNFSKMRDIARDERVQSCWSVAGQLRFKLKGEDQVVKVKCIYDPVDTIINK